MRALPLALLALLTLGEIRLFDRLLVGERDTAFVAESVRGVTNGYPVSRSWQQRLLGPWAVTVLSRATGDLESALRLFRGLLVALANLLLYVLSRRRGESERAALTLVAGFGLAHALFMYRLEYQWDWIDVLIFLWFGDHVARSGGLRATWPILLIGAVNHETILYVPLWYLLTPVEERTDRRSLVAVVAMIALGVVIFGLRHALYLGPPDLTNVNPEVPLPLIDNHLHVWQNLQRLVTNFGSLQAFVTLSLGATIVLLIARAPRRAAVWSLIVIATVVAFGYVNETRHYLPLIAFWFTYRGWTAPASRSSSATVRSSSSSTGEPPAA
jgi:hypothetical protein